MPRRAIQVTCVSRGLRATVFVVALAFSCAAHGLAAENVGLGRAPATSPGPPLGSITAGHLRGCAVRPDGTLACWGDNSSGQVDMIFKHGFQ
jgi:hypothetical protein